MTPKFKEGDKVLFVGKKWRLERNLVVFVSAPILHNSRSGACYMYKVYKPTKDGSQSSVIAYPALILEDELTK